MKLLVAFAFVFLLSSHLFAQSNPASDRSSILIDGKKPATYLEFVKTGVCNNGNYFTVIHVGPCERKSEADVQFEAAWIRFVNNTRWATMVDVQKMGVEPVVYGYRLANKLVKTAAKDGAEIDVIYDIESETGCDFHVDVPEGKPCARRETPVPAFYRRAVSGSLLVPPGQSIIFPVNREHLKKYLTIYVLYNYEWELTVGGAPPPSYDSQHRVYFSWYDLEKGLEEKKVNAVLKPKSGRQ